MNATLSTNKGSWDAQNNAPALSNSTSIHVAGDYYTTSIAGKSSFNSKSKGQYFAVGEIVVFNGIYWDKYDSLSPEAGFGSAINWNEAYNNYIVSGTFAGNVITLTQRDGGSLTIDLTGVGGSSLLYRDSFSVTDVNGQNLFTLSASIDHEDKTQVFIDGVYQQKTEYSVSGTTLAFDNSVVVPQFSTVEIISFSSVSLTESLANANILVGDSSAVAIARAVSGDATLSNTGALTLNTVPIAKGGTGATTAGAARTALGVEIGTDVQAYNASIATQSYVDSAISGLVNGAGPALDTLSELATALGNDQNFSTTVSTNIATKLPITTWSSSAASGITSTNVSNWNTAHGWGDHGVAGYATEARTLTINGISYDLSADRSWTIIAGVASFNTRTGAITLAGTDVTTALGYTPVTAARNLTINGTTYDLSADRSWSIAAGVVSFNTRGGAITLLDSDVTAALGYTPVTSARIVTINGTAYDLSTDRSWNISPGASVRTVTAVTATSGQTTFTVSGGYTVGLIDVYINGVKQAEADFTATNGTTVVLATGTTSGNIVETIKYTAGLGSLPLGGGTLTGALGGTSATFSGAISASNLSGTNTGNQTDITGNAGTATILATSRNINSVAFDGSADITIADATKLPLAGGTLTGALSVTNGRINLNGNASDSKAIMSLGDATYPTATIGAFNTGGTVLIAGQSGTGMTIGTTGAATFSSSVTAQGFQMNGTGGYGVLARADGINSAANGAYIGFVNNAFNRYFISQLDTNNDINYYYYNGSSWSSSLMKFSNTGAATFSGALSGTSATFSGNVGINNTIPSSFYGNASQLVVGDGSTSRGMTIYSSAAADGQIFFADGTTGADQYRGMLRYEHSSDALVFFTNATEKMRISSGGLATFTPTGGNGTGAVNAIHLKNTGAVVNDGTSILFTAGTSADGAAIKSTGQAFNSSDLRFFTGGSAAANERLTISSGGAATFNSSVRATNLGMNVAPISDRILYISGNLPTTGVSQFQSVMNGTVVNAATTIYGMYVGNNSNVNVSNSYAIYIETTGGSGTITNKYGIYQSSSGDKNYFAGNVGIGYTPTVALQVSGTIASGDGDSGWGRFLYDAGTVKIQASKNGTDAIGLSFWTQASGGAFSEKVSINGGGTLTTSNVGITNQNTYLGSGQLRVGGGLDHGSNVVLSIAPGAVRVDAPGVSGGRLNLDNSGNLTIGNNITAQGSLQVNTNGFSLKNWRQYAVQISAGASTNTGAIIFRQFQDSVNWNIGGVVVEIINYAYSNGEFDTRKDFARYGYSGNAAAINTLYGNVTGKIPQPYWGPAVQGSGVYYYRDLKIDISPYHSYLISLTTAMSLNGNTTVGNGAIYIFS